MTKTTYGGTYLDGNDVDGIKELLQNTHNKTKLASKAGIKFYNIPCAFDIETTSYEDENSNKYSWMYCWQMSINGQVIIGRTWEEFKELTNYMTEILNLSEKKHLVIYVHNLSFEYKYLKNKLNFTKVFAISETKVVSGLTTNYIEFRDSYILSNMGLKSLGESLTKYKVEKLDGDLDYTLIRHSNTPLTIKEIGYCINDVLVVTAYIQEQIELYGDITKIPQTMVQAVRKVCKKNCLKTGSKNDDSGRRYKRLMQGLTMELEEYKQLRRASRGGVVEVSELTKGKEYNNVCSFDINSAYPSLMVAFEYPMSKGRLLDKKVTLKEALNLFKEYCCLFDITFTDIEIINGYNIAPLSVHKCFDIKNLTEENNRVISASKLSTTLTEQEFMILTKFYRFKGLVFSNFRVYRKGYLPKELIETILDLYNIKTNYKGEEDKALEYNQAKINLNSISGMLNTAVNDTKIVFENETLERKENDLEQELNTYNNSFNRFTYYPWGVWLYSYCRSVILTMIKNFDVDFIYSDTDSIKGLHKEKHIKEITDYNKMITAKIDKCLNYYNIPLSKARPLDSKGNEKQLGIFSDEGDYTHFKALRPKLYLGEREGKLNLTISGANKNKVLEYLRNLSLQSNKDIFDLLDEEVIVTEEYSGKTVSYSLETPTSLDICDYRGITNHVEEEEGYYIENTSYTFNKDLAGDTFILQQREFSRAL